MASWERWEGSKVARWERWESSEGARWKFVDLFKGGGHRVGPIFHLHVSDVNADCFG